MDLRDLRYFVVLAEERHFGRAAERLYITQSGLSKAIRRAELGLGVTLFSRTRREVTLTPAGVALLDRAAEVLRAFEDVREAADAVRSGVVGMLAVATSPAARYQVTHAIFDRFTRAYTHVRAVHREQVARVIVEDLLAQRLDVGLAVSPPVREELRYEVLKHIPLRVLAPSLHPLAARRRIALADLNGESLVVSAEAIAAGSLDRLVPQLEAAGLTPNFVTDTVEYDEDLHAVRRGRGVRLSTRTFLGDPPPGIVALGLDPPLMLGLEMIWGAEEPRPLVARFLELARQVSAEQDWTTRAA